MEHQADLVPRLAPLLESLLGDQAAGADLCAQGEFFPEFTPTRLDGGFAGVDVAAGEVEVALFEVSAQEDRAGAGDDGPGDDFDVVGGSGHWWEYGSGVGCGQRIGGRTVPG